jgi:hypothetical protein
MSRIRFERCKKKDFFFVHVRFSEKKKERKTIKTFHFLIFNKENPVFFSLTHTTTKMHIQHHQQADHDTESKIIIVIIVMLSLALVAIINPTLPLFASVFFHLFVAFSVIWDSTLQNTRSEQQEQQMPSNIPPPSSHHPSVYFSLPP